jgi:CRISPR-associated protein Csc3
MMETLLQTLLLRTLPEETDPILRAYIETVLPAMEREFSLIPALGGSEEVQYHLLVQRGSKFAAENAKRYAKYPDQSLLVHVLNALLTAWNLLPFLNSELTLTDDEKRLLCLGLTLHDYNKWCHGEQETIPDPSEIPQILELCQTLGKRLNFDAFWAEWREYLTEIAYLAQNTQSKVGTNLPKVNWGRFKISDTRRLDAPLRWLLAFGDVAVHLSDPSDIAIETGGHRLREHLRFLGIHRKLVYHRLRHCTGILTNGIHNAVMLFARELDWQPLLFFAQGVVYLAPQDTCVPDCSELHEFLWEQVSELLVSSMEGGQVGFKRDGKGLKLAPQTRELFSPTQLIRNLPGVVKSRVANAKSPATRKRLEKMELSPTEQAFLAEYADLRADRIAEFIILAQKEFFPNKPEFITWMLETLGVQNTITPDQKQSQSGGVNYGWYRVAAHYIARHSTLDLEQLDEKLQEIAEQLAAWAEENKLLPEHHSLTREVFYDYLTQYLEVQGWEQPEPSFERELAGYISAKTSKAKHPICSLSSAEFASEDQMDSVVLFKPQQYSNKNPLGGTQIKRGISKIWALEMLLRQMFWSVPAGKLEDQQPVFLYIFPAYVYSPQVAATIRLLMNELKGVNFGEVCRHWLEHGMDAGSLRSFSWLAHEDKNSSQSDPFKYSREDLPFMAMHCTTTRGKTVTEAWIEPAFLTLTLPFLLGVKVVATSSQIPLYNSDQEFRESVKLDDPPSFWNWLGLPTSLHLQNWVRGRVRNLAENINRLLVAYFLHLDSHSARQSRNKDKDSEWRKLNDSIREVANNILNVFLLAKKGLRHDSSKRNPTKDEINRYWSYAQMFAEGDTEMETKLKITKRLASEYRQFYRVGVNESSYAILLPFSRALEHILSVPNDWDDEELIVQGSGQLRATLERQEIYKRPIMQNKDIPFEVRRVKEFEAIQTFMTTCVIDVFGRMCKGDRALLQEHRNRLKSGVEFAYLQLALQDQQATSKPSSGEQS